MGLQADSSPSESVIVVMDANRNKGTMDALEWALKHIVCRGDTVIVLGVVVYEFGKKRSCFPVNFGIGISGIWERLEFSSQGQEARPRELGEEIERKREKYQNSIQPFYKQCKKNEVNLEVKLAFGFCPEKITVEQAQNSNPRWIVLDSLLKKYRLFIYGHVGCNIAVMKGKVATWTPSKAAPSENPPGKCKRIDDDGQMMKRSVGNNQIDVVDSREWSSFDHPQPAQSPCWYPLSWRSGFPRAFTQAELEANAKCFSEENVASYDSCGIKIYEGLFQETPVVVTSFSENDERFWTVLKILSRIRHRNIMNLVGYCCTGTSMFLLCDYPCMGTLGTSLQCDDSAKNLPWKARWYIALEIGGCLRYLHEECVDGAIVHLSVSSANVVLSHGCSAMLGNFLTARWLQDDSPSNDQWGNLKDDERLAIDVCDYGMLLMEIITGKSAKVFQSQSGGQTLTEWALPFLANGRVKEVLDPRVQNSCDNKMVYHMVNAALLCLRNDSARRFSISEVLAVVRGDQRAVTHC